MPEVYPYDSHSGNHRLAIIVPFRNRFEELQEFVPYMKNFLRNQSIVNDIYIVNQVEEVNSTNLAMKTVHSSLFCFQVDDFRFNRASLINIGFLHVNKLSKYDYIVMHDVDLIPINPQLRYSFPEEGNALHIASPKTHPKYHYDNFVGGILILTSKDFLKLNGLSNRYWGWGLEDDEFYLRMKQGGVKVNRPENITTGPTNTFKWVFSSFFLFLSLILPSSLFSFEVLIELLETKLCCDAGISTTQSKEVVTWSNVLIRKLPLVNVTGSQG